MTVSTQDLYTARYFGPFRIATELKQEQFDMELNEPTIRDLIDNIIQKHPELESSFFVNGKLNNNVNIVINGEDVRSKQELSTKISPHDRITFFKGVGGG